MEGGFTDQDRTTLLRAAIARVEREQMRQALSRTADLTSQAPKVAINALNALRKHRDPVSVVDRAQYRVALPWVAAVIADECLSRTIEVLGDHSDDPTAEQLRSALDDVRSSFSDVTIAVMLASVADSAMPSSDLCFEIAVTDEQYGLADWSEADDGAGVGPAPARDSRQPTPEQREARRIKKQQEAEERRKRQDAARRAGEQARRGRKRQPTGGGTTGSSGPAAAPDREPVPTDVIRRPALTPVQLDEFDPEDPWVSAVIFAWVPFRADESTPDLDGKSRRCVVVAGSATHLLVRPGYSDGGVASRDWKSVPLRHWRKAGFDRPTWIEGESLTVPRDPAAAPVGWLAPEDWNALW